MLIVCAAVLWKSASAIANIAGRSARLILRLSNLFITTLLAPRLRRKPSVHFLTLKRMAALKQKGAMRWLFEHQRCGGNLARGEGFAKPLVSSVEIGQPQRGEVKHVLLRRVAARAIVWPSSRGFAKPSPWWLNYRRTFGAYYGVLTTGNAICDACLPDRNIRCVAC